MRHQSTVKGEVLSLYNHDEQPPQSSMTCTVHMELVKKRNLKQVTNDFVDSVWRRSSIFGHFFHSNIRCGSMPLTLPLNIQSCASNI